MAKCGFSIVDDMVDFMDRLLCVWPAIERMKKTKRKTYIVDFLREAGFIKRNKRKRLGVTWTITEECSEAITRGAPRDKRDYFEVARSCIPHHPPSTYYGLGVPLNDEWYFISGVSSIFSYEQKLFFRWLRARSFTIGVGLKLLPKHGHGRKSTIDAISFALGVLTLTEVAECRPHYISQSRRDTKRRKERRRARQREECSRQQVEQFIINDKSSVKEKLSTEVTTRSPQAVPLESPDAVATMMDRYCASNIIQCL
jgi:hypothetical protein